MTITRTKEALEWRMQEQIRLFYLWKNELGELETDMETEMTDIPGYVKMLNETCQICGWCVVSPVGVIEPKTMLHLTNTLCYCFKCRDAILEKLPDPVCIKGCDD